MYAMREVRLLLDNGVEAVIGLVDVQHLCEKICPPQWVLLRYADTEYAEDDPWILVGSLPEPGNDHLAISKNGSPEGYSSQLTLGSHPLFLHFWERGADKGWYRMEDELVVISPDDIGWILANRVVGMSLSA